MYDDDLGTLDQYEGVTPEWVTETESDRTSFDLIPAGTHEGQIVGFKTKTVDEPTSPYVGTLTIRLEADLFIDGQTRKYFFSASPVRAKDSKGRIREETRNFVDLATATNTIGKRPSDVLNAAMMSRLRFELRQSPAKGKYKARNWTNRIMAAE